MNTIFFLFLAAAAFFALLGLLWPKPKMSVVGPERGEPDPPGPLQRLSAFKASIEATFPDARVGLDPARAIVKVRDRVFVASDFGVEGQARFTLSSDERDERFETEAELSTRLIAMVRDGH